MRIPHLIWFVVLLASPWAKAQVPVNEKTGTSFMHYYLKGEESFEKQDYQQALTFYNEALQLYPYHADSYFSRAVTREKLEDIDGALQDYTLTLALKPEQYDALFSKALILYHQRKWNLAKNDFQQLLSLPNGETTSIFFQQDRFSGDVNGVFTTQGSSRALLYNYLGLTESELKNFESALTYLDSAIVLNPDEANYYVNKGKCLEALGEKEKASDNYRMALELKPDHSIAKHNLSILQRTSGNTTDALQLLNEMIEKNPELPFPYAERAYHYSSGGRNAEAINDYNKAIDLAPLDAEYYLNRGLVHEKMNALEKAYDDFSYALSLDEDLARAWLSRANLLYKLAKYRDAIEDYDIAIFKSEDYGIAFYNRALAKHRIGLLQQACEDLQRATSTGFNVPEKTARQICKSQ